ncbi:MAG: protein kinase [Isosphaeraceae bacterium]|nr:protein kinase [Isosphaeraceae bacterium]
MPDQECPSHADLAAFDMGVLSVAMLDRVADHLEWCPRCEAAVKALDHTSDPILDSLRSFSGLPVSPSARDVAMPTTTRVGEYEILGELGRGAMGVVYKAYHARLRRVVALKMLPGGELASDGYRARFLAEAEAVARLQHANIVQIFDFGEWDGAAGGPPVPYFTLEYADGGNLNTRLGGKPQPPDRAAEWLLTLARAVHYAHRQGIVHRDLKPSNVLVTAEGQLKLCDFGVAKVLAGSSHETLGGLLVGTPEYMAPEQAHGQSREAGPAADVYALGTMLYAMLTGRPPFQSASMLETLEQVRSQEPVPPRRLQPSVPHDLQTICLKCLQKEPRRRYATAAALAEDLDRFLTRRPILARPATLLEQAWKRARRRPTEAMLVSAITATALLGFTLVVWQWQRAETKAAAEAAANLRAQQARRLSVEQQAQLALRQGLTLCNDGDVKHGLLWLGRSLQLATSAQAEGLDRPIRINIAAWEDQFCRSRAEVGLREPIAGLAFSPDGRTLAAIAGDHAVLIRDAAEAGRPLAAERLPTARPTRCIAFVRQGEGLLATAADDGRVTIWDPAARRPVGSALVHPPGRSVVAMVPTPDGRLLITCCDDGSIRRWDMATGELIRGTLQHGTGTGNRTLAPSLDGRTLISGGEDGIALRWDLATGRRIDPPMRHDSAITAIAFGRDGRAIITGTRDGRLHVWDAEGARVSELPSQGAAVTGLDFAPAGEIFAAATAGGVVRLWDLNMLGRPAQTLMPGRAATRVAFHPGGQVVATGQHDGRIQLWTSPRPLAIGRPLPLDRPVEGLSFRDGSRLLVVAGGEVQTWDFDHEELLSRSGKGRSPAELVIPSPDGHLLATEHRTGAGGARVELRDATTRELLRATPEQPGPILGAAFSPDSRSLLTWTDQPGCTRLWDVATLRDPRPMLQALDASLQRAVFRADGRTIVAGCRDGTARLWDVESDEEINPGLRPQHAYPVTAIAYPPRGERVVAGCQDGSVGMWDLSNGKLLFEARGRSSEVTALTFSLDGQVILTAGRDGTACFLDAVSGQPLGPPLHHRDAVLSAAFHADGQRAATGTGGGEVRRWRAPPPPATGSSDEIRRRIEDETGLWLDYQGAIHALFLRPGLRESGHP